jgi:hypothetical protein
MVRIKQHADDGSLNDLNRFLADIDQFYQIDHWIAGDLEITGDNALAIEKRCGSGIRLPDAEFRDMYRGIFQTIWGCFAVEERGQVVAQINAIDSSEWEVDSRNPAFEKHMRERYGEYGV